MNIKDKAYYIKKAKEIIGMTLIAFIIVAFIAICFIIA